MFQRKAAAIVLGLSLLMAIPAHAETSLNLRMDNRSVQLSAPLQSMNNRTMILLDDLASMLHGTVKQDNRIVTLSVGSTQFGFHPDSPEIRLGNSWVKVDQGACLIKNRVYVPLRWVLEHLAFQVNFDTKTRTVLVKGEQDMDEFRPVKLDDLTEAEKQFVLEKRRIKGVHRMGDLVVIARGEVPNPGYGIELAKQSVSWEQVRIFVKLTRPEPGQIYPQVISYPYLAGKINLAPYTTLQVLDADTEKALFQ